MILSKWDFRVINASLHEFWGGAIGKEAETVAWEGDDGHLFWSFVIDKSVGGSCLVGGSQGFALADSKLDVDFIFVVGHGVCGVDDEGEDGVDHLLY